MCKILMQMDESNSKRVCEVSEYYYNFIKVIVWTVIVWTETLKQKC